MWKGLGFRETHGEAADPRAPGFGAARRLRHPLSADGCLGSRAPDASEA